MEKIKKLLNENKILLIVAIFIVFTVFMPDTQGELVVGDDYEYHLSRIQSVSDSLKQGIFPVKIHAQMANGYGYASGIFYSNFFIYIPAILNLLGFHIITSYKIFILFMIIFAFVISYFSLVNMTGDKKSALIGVIVILLSRNIIFNLYHRFALGEFLGFIFILPIISGMYDFVYKDFKKPWLLILGFCGVIHSHIITTVLCIIFCVLFFLINLKYISKDWKKVIKLIISAMIVLLLTASFWIPFLEQYFIQDYMLSKSWTKIENSEYKLIDLFGNRKTAVGYFILMLMPIYVYSLMDSKTDKITKGFIITLFIIMGITIFDKFWDVTKSISNIIQFKWRLVGIITVFAGISMSMIIKDYKDSFKFDIDILVIGMLIISMFFVTEFTNFDNRTNIRKSKDDIVFEMYKSVTSIGGGKEYLPLDADYDKLIFSNIVFGNTGSQIPVEKNGLNVIFEKQSEDTSFVVPYLYYYGYVAEIIDESGNKKKLDIEKSNDGLVKVNMESTDKGMVSVYYKNTLIQTISYVISIITCIGIIVYIIIKIVEKYKSKKSKI